MLDRGLTEDGAATALGWPKARVTARVKILELPERAQEMIGAGLIALSAVDKLRAIGRVSPALLDSVVAFLADGNERAAERLAREPGWVLDSALRQADAKVFAAHLSQVDSREIAELRLGKKIEELYVEAETLHKQIDRYAYGPPPIRFSEADVDQARAAAVLIEFERSAPIIVDRALYRELVKVAVRCTVEQLRDKAAALAEQRKQDRRSGRAPADPVAAARRERDLQLRELADQAHSVNLDLGQSLLNGLSTVDPSSVDVAKFFVLCGRPHSTNYADFATMPMRCAAAARGRRSVVASARGATCSWRFAGTRPTAASDLLCRVRGTSATPRRRSQRTSAIEC
jgi:hypothetical protein